MRTKTLLLSAAALLVAGVVSTQAQPVYSQNIVGYATVPTTNASSYYMMTVPFAIGVSNGANEVFGLAANPNALPNGTEILTFNVMSQNYVISYYDPTTTPPWWDSANENYNVPTPALPAGMGFFLLPSGPVTNTFAGTIALNVGSTNKFAMTNASSYYLMGSLVPYAGAVTNGSAGGGGIDLNALPNGTEVLTFDVPSQSYIISYFDPTTFPTPWWDSANENYNVPAPVVSVGQGFFVLPSGNYTWTNSLPSN